MRRNHKKVVIVHDWLYGGGAELVVLELHKLFPEAPIYTSFCTGEWRSRLDNVVVTGYLQHWPFSTLRKFLPVLRQHWFKHLDLSEYDVVISSSGNGEARFAQASKPNAVHISYTHTPPHFYWRKYKEYIKNPGFGHFNWVARLGLRLLVSPLRRRDFTAAQKIDAFMANSNHIKKDIKTYYKRDSVVVFPPVDTQRFRIDPSLPKRKREHYVIWGRHVPYKRFDLAIKACNTLKLQLIVIGTGPETEALKKIAGPTITFTGRISQDEFDQYTKHAKGFIFPGSEDFGIAPVEAIAAGIPVIAYKHGGALDYVIENKTGVFFDKQTLPSLISALKRFEKKRFSAVEMSRFAEKFSNENFKKSFQRHYKKILSL